jgi:hypothetical protein
MHAKMKRPIYCLASATISGLYGHPNNPLFVCITSLLQPAHRKNCSAVALSYQTWSAACALKTRLQNSSKYKNYFYYFFAITARSGDSSVGIAIGYGLDTGGTGIRSPTVVGEFYLLHSVQISSGPHLASYTMGTGHCFPGVKRQCGKLSPHLHLVPKFRMRGAIHPSLQYAFMA